MDYTVQTSKGTVNFRSVGEPIVEIPTPECAAERKARETNNLLEAVLAETAVAV